MRLLDLKNQGTYVGLRVLQPYGTWLYKWVRDYLPYEPSRKSQFERRLHTTVIYSRKHCPNLTVDPSIVHTAEFVDFDIFGDDIGEKILVAKFNAPSVTARHLQFMAKYGCTHDYPTFQLHVSLCYSFTGLIKDIPPLNFNIKLGEEYTEDLNLNWK